MPTSHSCLGFIPLQLGHGLPLHKLSKRSVFKTWTSKANVEQSAQEKDNFWVPCKVFRCGERHIFLGPTKSLTNSKALPIEIECNLDADLLRSALGFYRTQRVSLFMAIGTLLYLLGLKRKQLNHSSFPRFLQWKSIVAILYKTLMFRWTCSLEIVQKLIQDMHWTPVKVLIQDEVLSSRNEDKKHASQAQLFFTSSRTAQHHQCSVVYVPRSFAIAVASAYRIPIYVSRMLVERNSVFPQVDCRGKWYVAHQTTCSVAHLSRNAPIWKYRISELEKMETQQLYNIMIRSGISCSRATSHQDLINQLIPFMDRLQRRSVSIWKELWKRKMYKSLKKKLA